MSSEWENSGFLQLMGYLAIEMRDQYIEQLSRNEESISVEDTTDNESVDSRQGPLEGTQDSVVREEDTDGMSMSEAAMEGIDAQQLNPEHEPIRGPSLLEARVERDVTSDQDDREINEMERQMDAVWESNGKQDQQK